MNLARVFYIPAMISVMAGIYCLYNGQATNAAIIGIYGAMLSLIGFCAAIRAAKMIKL